MRLRPLQLGHRRLEPEVSPCSTWVRTCHRVQPQRLEVDERRRRAARAAPGRCARPSVRATVDDRVVLATELGVLADADAPRSNDSSSIATRQPSSIVAEHLVGGHLHVGEEHLAELLVTGHLLERPGVDAVGWCMSISSIEMPRWRCASGSVRTSAKIRSACSGVGGPHLLAVDDEVVAVADGPGGQRRRGRIRRRARRSPDTR